MQLAGNLSWQLEPALASNLPGNLQLADNLQLANWSANFTLQHAGNLQLANLSWQLAGNLQLANLSWQLAGNLQFANLSWQLVT